MRRKVGERVQAAALPQNRWIREEQDPILCALGEILSLLRSRFLLARYRG
ncbi:MAG: hypothetical protein WDO69_03770 [Pseudomonadota bacterium]